MSEKPQTQGNRLGEVCYEERDTGTDGGVPERSRKVRPSAVERLARRREHEEAGLATGEAYVACRSFALPVLVRFDRA